MCLLQKYVNFASVINVIIFIIYVKTGAWMKQGVVVSLNLQWQPQCNVQTFNSLHAVDLGTLYGRECI